MKTSLRNLFLSLVSVLAFAGNTWAAAPHELVDGIKLSGIEAYSGNQISVFYLSAREGTVGNPGQNLFVKTVKQVQTATIGRDILDIPSIEVPKSGFEVVNYIAFVVHRQARVFLKNSDGSFPKDGRLPPNSQPTNDEQRFVKLKFIALIRAQDFKNGQVYQFDFARDLSE